jgi:signal transduction histidine kinase
MPLGSPGIGPSVGLYVLRDITQHKQAEQALTEANRKISLLSSITRHDIRNQLMALSAYLMLSEDSMDDPVLSAEYLRMEQKITSTIAHQISFTKYYEDFGVNTPEWQDVNTCIRQAMDSLVLGTVRVEITVDNLEVFADPLLEKVFYNLIDNSLRYGGPGVTLFRVTSTTSEGALALMFEDDGVGIPADDKLRIFDKGFGTNTGLGLFLSREILSLNGATIEETGEPGKCARFVIRVPPGAWRNTSPQ